MAFRAFHKRMVKIETLKAKPFLRWAGSKKQLLPVLESYWGGEKRYLEPFCGSGALFFHIGPDRAFLNDSNKDVFNAFQCVQQHPEDLFDIYSKWECDEQTYNAIKGMQPDDLDNIQRAARFIYLMRQCYGGIYRTNLRGQFNVPFGKCSTGKMPTKEELLCASLSLNETTITNQDYRAFLAQYAQNGDFVYLDPPYAESRLDYSAEQNDKEKLLETLCTLDQVGATFVLSCSSDFYVNKAVENDWSFVEVEVRRSIASKASNRKRVKEFIVSNKERRS